MEIKQVGAALLIAATLLLSSCGGGGGGGSGLAAPSNSWDSMIWDQGNWV